MKSLFILFFLAGMPAIGLAQKDRPALTFRAGPNLNNLRGNPVIEEYHRSMVAYYAGIDGKLPLAKYTNLVLGVAYQVNGSSMKNAQITDNSGNIMGTGKVRHELSYLTIPLMVEVSAGNDIKLNFQIGVFGSYLLDDVAKIKMDQNPNNLEDWEEDQGNYKKGNGGIVSGLGVEIPIQNSLFFTIQARNQTGLLNISKVSIMDGGYIRTSSYGFLFGIGKRF